VQHAGAREQHVALRGAQVVDLVLGGDDRIGQRAAAREGQRVVCQVAEHAAMGEAVLLLELGPQREAQFGERGAEGQDLGAQQHAEGLGLQHRACMRQLLGLAHGAGFFGAICAGS